MKISVNVIIVALIYLFLVQTPVKCELPVVSAPHFTMSLLSKEIIRQDEVRAFLDLADSVKKECQRSEKLGMQIKEPVSIILTYGNKYMVTDLWKAFGISPAESFWATLRSDILGQNAFKQVVENRKYNDKIWRKYSLFNGIPSAKSEFGSDVINEVAEGEVDTFIEKLKNSLSLPLQSCKPLYLVLSEPGYVAHQNTIWIPIENLKGLHRLRGDIMHEMAHHIFASLVNTVTKQHRIIEKLSVLQIELLSSIHLMALNEFFADYLVIANGENLIIKMHTDKYQLDELKRYFSKKRTFAEFQKLASDPKTAHFYLEAHNTLNPMRSFIWQLKLHFGLLKTNKLVIAATRLALTDFYTLDVDKYPHRSTESLFPGAFVLKGYDSGLVAENTRALKSLIAAAKGMLNNKETGIFYSTAREIFGQKFLQAAKGEIENQ